MLQREADLRRLVSAATALALHLGFLTAFLFANSARTLVSGRMEEIELRFPAPPPLQQLPPASALQPKLISPAAPAFPVIPGRLFAPPSSAAPAPGAISGVGRALFGCDPQKLDTLSAQDRAACLRTPSGKALPQSVRMPPPPDPNSPFTKEIEERFREAKPINQPCPLGSFNDTHGLPCFGFAGEEAEPIAPHE
jgi:hypothetical protein